MTRGARKLAVAFVVVLAVATNGLAIAAIWSSGSLSTRLASTAVITGLACFFAGMAATYPGGRS